MRFLNSILNLLKKSTSTSAAGTDNNKTIN